MRRPSSKSKPEPLSPGFLCRRPQKVLRYPGVNLLTEARATAISCNVANDRMPSAAIDGDPVTYWESGAPGPVSFQIRWEAPTQISGLVVEWKDREPDTLQIEALQSEDQWKSLLFRAGKNDNQTTVMEIDQAAEVIGLRFSVPETRPARDDCDSRNRRLPGGTSDARLLPRYRGSACPGCARSLRVRQEERSEFETDGRGTSWGKFRRSRNQFSSLRLQEATVSFSLAIRKARM